ncbi:MAG: hypothetical protein HC930_08370 [Hydrococcus sp. SU_1_0]|nr:hypothetical protein [Hydrococcus sp. SU_1_0]
MSITILGICGRFLSILRPLMLIYLMIGFVTVAINIWLGVIVCLILFASFRKKNLRTLTEEYVRVDLNALPPFALLSDEESSLNKNYII